MTRPLLLATTESVAKAQEAFHADTLAEVIRAVEHDDLVVVGMGWNPFVKKARKALDQAGFTYTYLEYGNYLSLWRKRLAIKLWSGWPTFPQVFVRGTLIGGSDRLIEEIAQGTLKARLAPKP